MKEPTEFWVPWKSSTVKEDRVLLPPGHTGISRGRRGGGAPTYPPLVWHTNTH